MDKYDVSHDSYCYAGTSVLKNKLNIQSDELLEQAEQEITAHTVQGVIYSPPPYDLAYLQQLHKTIFSKLYDWAGEIRTVDISKGNTRFCNVNNIARESEKLFSKLERVLWLADLEKEDFCEKLAEFYIEINMIHPFREGNGRV